MAFIPEPTLFGTPPADATPLQSAAYYAHFAGHPVAALAVLVALARCAKKGVVSHLMIALGAALAGGATFAGQNLYNNFIYRETVRMATETPLLLLTGGVLVTGLGTMFIPGMLTKRGAWVRAIVPAMAAIGVALAAIAHLPDVNRILALGLPGGILAALAGGLLIFDKVAPGQNPQENSATAFGAGLILTGGLLAAGCVMGTPVRPGHADLSELAFALAEIAFGLFTLIAVLSVKGASKDFAWMKTRPPKPGSDYVPPPPGYVPPPPPTAPRGPSAPRAPGPARPPQQHH